MQRIPRLPEFDPRVVRALAIISSGSSDRKPQAAEKVGEVRVTPQIIVNRVNI
jgi:hypothetical protein